MLDMLGPLSSAPAPALATKQQPQIIVIPQSLIKQMQISGPLAAATNKGASTGVRIVTTNTSTMPSVGIKRPLAPASPGASSDSGDDTQTLDASPRKRANLDHLTPEEKLMRRKLKNRVAAQNARDKKRVRMEEMEDMLKHLEDKMHKIQQQNEQLLAMNERLMEENRCLRKIKKEPEEALPPSPLSLPPSSPSSVTSVDKITVDSCPALVSAARTNAAARIGSEIDAEDRHGEDVHSSGALLDVPDGAYAGEQLLLDLRTAAGLELHFTDEESNLTAEEENDDLVGAKAESLESCKDLGGFYHNFLQMSAGGEHAMDKILIAKEEDLLVATEQQAEQDPWEESFDQLFPDLM